MLLYVPTETVRLITGRGKAQDGHLTSTLTQLLNSDDRLWLESGHGVIEGVGVGGGGESAHPVSVSPDLTATD